MTDLVIPMLGLVVGLVVFVAYMVVLGLSAARR